MSYPQYPMYPPEPANPYQNPNAYANPYGNPYANPQAYPYMYPPVQAQTTNGLAIASLIFGIIGVQILAWVFGGIALSQISRTGQKGRGLAIAGIIIGIGWAVIALMLLANR